MALTGRDGTWWIPMPCSRTWSQLGASCLQMSITATDLIPLCFLSLVFFFANIHSNEKQKFNKVSAEIWVRWMVKSLQLTELSINKPVSIRLNSLSYTGDSRSLNLEVWHKKGLRIPQHPSLPSHLVPSERTDLQRVSSVSEKQIVSRLLSLGLNGEGALLSFSQPCPTPKPKHIVIREIKGNPTDWSNSATTEEQQGPSWQQTLRHGETGRAECFVPIRTASVSMETASLCTVQFHLVLLG